MEFVNPVFLYGLFALSIPIIIHLFNFRRFKKVYFTNVKFLTELKQQTRKQSKLRHLLVLIMRMTAIAALVLAFAQPYIPVSKKLINKSARNIISIYIDNSFSMQASSDEGTMLDKAKERAREIAGVYKSSDRFQLLTNDFEGQHQRFISKEEFMNMVDDIEISPVMRTTEEVLLRQTDLLKTANVGMKSAYLISDFQKNMLQPGNLPAIDSLVNVFIIPVETVNGNNLYLDSCWFEAPVYQLDQQVKLFVGIKNSSGIDYEKIPVKLKVDGVKKGLASFDIRAGQKTVVEIVFRNRETGIRQAELEINDYPISFDDKLYFSYYVSPVTKILCINGDGESRYLNSLFGNDTTFNFINVKQRNLNYSSFNQYDVIILNEVKNVSSGLANELKRFTTDGGSLVIFPSGNINLDNYSQFLATTGTDIFTNIDTIKTKINFIDFENPMFNDVFDEIPENIDLPVVYKSYITAGKLQKRRTVLLEMQNGNSFLTEYFNGQGKIFLFAVPLDDRFSNFPKHAIFVPVMIKIAVSGYKNDRLFYTIGKNEIITLHNANITGDNVFKIKSVGSDFELIPDQRAVGANLEIYPHGRIKKAGNYFIMSGNKRVKGVSFNYNREESEMIFYTAGELKEIIDNVKSGNFFIVEPGNQPFEETVSDMSRGIRLWMWFVIIALAALAVETFLLRVKTKKI